MAERQGLVPHRSLSHASSISYGHPTNVVSAWYPNTPRIQTREGIRDSVASRPVTGSVNLKYKLKLDDRWTFVPVAKKNGHYVADQVMIAGVPTKVHTGTYYVEWYARGKRIQKSVGRNGHEAIAAWKQQTTIHDLRASGVEIRQDSPALASTMNGTSLAMVVKDYVATHQLVGLEFVWLDRPHVLLRLPPVTERRTEYVTVP